MEYSSFSDFRERAGYVIDGVWYPRVTSIVAIKAKPALYRYYAGMPNWVAADAVKERSAEEGSRVHDAVEAILKGDSPILDDVTSPAVDAFTAFLATVHLKPLSIEERLVSRLHGYAGTIDVLAEIDGVIGVLDIKTGKSIYRDYGMQAAAYAAALREHPSRPHPTTAWVLRLDRFSTCAKCGGRRRSKGGTMRINGSGVRSCRHTWGPEIGQYEFRELPSYEEDFRAFLAAKTLWEWEHKDYLARLRG